MVKTAALSNEPCYYQWPKRPKSLISKILRTSTKCVINIERICYKRAGITTGMFSREGINVILIADFFNERKPKASAVVLMGHKLNI